MELTKEAIRKNEKKILGLEGYRLVVSKIEKNVNSNPDIAIESCKSLIEGLAKKALELLSDEYNKDKNLRKRCNNKLPTLIRKAFSEIYTKKFEIDLHTSLYSLINNKNRVNKLVDSGIRSVSDDIDKSIRSVSVFRDNRGDISHGRIYPKVEESEIALSKSIQAITDGICSFMIYEFSRQYQLKKNKDEKLSFEEEEEEFNEWLNEKHQVLSIKVDFSELLYNNAYKKYEEFYYSEYLNSIDIEITEEESQAAEEIKIDGQVVATKKIEELVNTFDDKAFWGAEKDQQLRRFVSDNDLDLEMTKQLINDFFSFDKRPQRDKVAVLMNTKPSLQERKKVTEALLGEVIHFAEHLKSEE